MANKVIKEKDAHAFYFSLSAFFKGVGDSLYAFFVSAGEAIQRLYTMFEASMARKMYGNRYSRVFSTEQRDHERHLGALLAYYDDKIAPEHFKRAFRVPQSDEPIASDDTFLEDKLNARELMQLLQEGLAFEDKMYYFILSFVKHRQSIRHLDFSDYVFTGDALNRFEFFLTELLSVHPQITCISVHPDHAEHFRLSKVSSRIHMHKQQASAYRLLTDNTEKSNLLANQRTVVFFEKNQRRTMEEYNEKTAHFLQVITPEAQKESINDLMRQKEGVPVDKSTPWYFIAWARRELSEKLTQVLNTFKKEPEQDTSKEQQLMEDDRESSSSYASLAYSWLSGARDSVVSTVSNILSPKEESPFSYLDEKDSNEIQLRAISKEVERILALWKGFEALEFAEPIEERMKAQARIVASILYQGLYMPAAMSIRDSDIPPEKQKSNLFHPNGRCRHYSWSIYGDESDNQKERHAKAFNIIQHGAMTWLENLKNNSLDLTSGLKIHLTEYIQTQRDIALIDIAGQRHDRALERQGEALERQGEALDRMGKMQEENAKNLDECFRLDAFIKEQKKKRDQTISPLKQSDSNDSFFNSQYKTNAQEHTDKSRQRSLSDSKTREEESVLCL
jgi:hypothetical protein